MTDIINGYKDQCGACVKSLKGSLSTLKSGRASADIFDEVIVNAYNEKFPLKELG